MVGYDDEYNPYFTLKNKRKSKTDAFLPTAPANYTLAPQAQTMPDLSGGNQNGDQSMPSALSSLVGLQAKPQGNPNQNTVLPDGTQQKGGLYDDWKKPVFGNMPLDKFVQLTGMMANAIAPNEWSGRLGRDMANMAGQAGMDRRAYEEREQQRADINKRYEEQKKENRLNRLVDFASKSKNPALQKIAYDKWKSEYEPEFGTLPDWDAMETPTLMTEISQFQKDAKELGWGPEDTQRGVDAILKNAYGIKDENPERDDITNIKGINPETKKPVYLRKSGAPTDITPYEKPEKSGGGEGGGSNKSVKEAETRINTYLRKAEKDRDTVVKMLDKHPEGDPKHNDLMNKLSGWDANIAQAEETLAMVQNGELRPEEIKWGGNKGGVKAKPLDAVTAAKILQEAGGDKNKARTIAKQRGYSF